MKGLVHIYCGDGKGKTSAAIGLAVRAAGRNLRVLLVRFLKNDDSGEVSALKEIPGIDVVPCDRSFGFTFRMTPMEREKASAYFQERFHSACRVAAEEDYDVLILDEIMAACSSGMVSEEAVAAFLRTRPERLEVVLTGRTPSGKLLELADYVSEIQAVRHPFSEGVKARRGIEY